MSASSFRAASPEARPTTTELSPATTPDPDAPEEKYTTDGSDRDLHRLPLRRKDQRKLPQLPRSSADRRRPAPRLPRLRVGLARNTGGYDVASNLSRRSELHLVDIRSREPSRGPLFGHHGGDPGTDDPTNHGPIPTLPPAAKTAGRPNTSAFPLMTPSAASLHLDPSAPTPASGPLPLAPRWLLSVLCGRLPGIPVRFATAIGPRHGGLLNPGPSAKPAGHIGKDLSADGDPLRLRLQIQIRA